MKLILEQICKIIILVYFYQWCSQQLKLFFINYSKIHACEHMCIHIQQITFCFFYFLKNLMLVYFWERERERERERGGEQAGGEQRERETESLSSSILSAQSLKQGSNPWTLRSWPELKPRVRCLTEWAAQLPLFLLIFFNVYLFLRLRERDT